jgi:hypothetical protein
MVDLKNELSKFTAVKYDKKLSYHLACAFWPFHVDNAADQSFLMLGYEPSEIESELHIADYYKYANESNAATIILKSSLQYLKIGTSALCH